MTLEDAIEKLLVTLKTDNYIYDKHNHIIKKKSIFIYSAVEQNQLLKIVEALEQLGILFEVELDGNIKLSL